MKLMKRLIYFLASAYVLMFFSEYYFVNEGPAFDFIKTIKISPISGLTSLLDFALFYVFFSYILWIAIDKFTIRDIWGLILAGVLFGWWTEGVVIPVLYEALPWSIIWPSVGWHLIVDVLLGWYLVRKILNMNKPVWTISLSLALGIFWGIWASWYWEEGVVAISPQDFWAYTFYTSLVLIPSLWVVSRKNWQEIKVTKIEVVLFSLLSLISIVLQGISLGLVPVIILIGLIALVLLALRRRSQQAHHIETNIDDHHRGKWWQFILLLIMPLSASLTYEVIYVSQPITDLVPFVGGLLSIAGTILLLIALFKSFKLVSYP